MNTQTYQNILRLLKKWPVDSTKLGRDLGEYIRKEVVAAFNPQAGQTLNLEVWDGIQASLSRIAVDRYKNSYPVSSAAGIATATGLSADNCHEALSNEFIETYEEELTKESPLVAKTKKLLRVSEKQ